jgi:DnaJ-class molecular chaperone
MPLEDCPECEGTGQNDDRDDCTYCEGTGKRVSEEKEDDNADDE